MFQLPPPPVPLTLREMLKDYPELIEELQEVLNKIVTTPPKGIPPFEWAIWRLEDTLSALRSDAQDELEAAEQSGDPVAIERAKAKELSIGRARFRSPWSRGQELSNYFQTYRRAFE